MAESDTGVPGESDATVLGIWKRQNATEAIALAPLAKRSPEAARRRADEHAHEAEALLNIELRTGGPVAVGAGGEAVLPQGADRSFVDTLLQKPDMVAVDASRARLGLAHQAGGLALALDAAETVKAANSLEKMLGHQVAAAHVAAIRLQAQAMDLLAIFQRNGQYQAILTCEAARLANASARMMESAQRTVMTLHRLRHGGQQTLVVQHVDVRDGGRAVVAGSFDRQRRVTRSKAGGRIKN